MKEMWNRAHCCVSAPKNIYDSKCEGIDRQGRYGAVGYTQMTPYRTLSSLGPRVGERGRPGDWLRCGNEGGRAVAGASLSMTAAVRPSSM